MSAQRQVLIDQNIDEMLLGRLLKKSNDRLRVNEKPKDECKSMAKDINRTFRRARGFWLLETKNPKFN